MAFLTIHMTSLVGTYPTLSINVDFRKANPVLKDRVSEKFSVGWDVHRWPTFNLLRLVDPTPWFLEYLHHICRVETIFVFAFAFAITIIVRVVLPASHRGITTSKPNLGFPR